MGESCSKKRMAATASLRDSSGTYFILSLPAHITLPLPVVRRGWTRAWKGHALGKNRLTMTEPHDILTPNRTSTLRDEKNENHPDRCHSSIDCRRVLRRA